MVQRKSQKRRSQKGGLESAREVNSLVGDIRLMFSSDKALAKKYQEDPKAFARAVARKHKVRMNTAAAAVALAGASAMIYGVARGNKGKTGKKSSRKETIKANKALAAKRAKRNYEAKAKKNKKMDVGKTALAKVEARAAKTEGEDVGFGDAFFSTGGKRGRRRRRRSSKRRSSKRRR
tara:strand:- start:2002 stop:2535 length:534 start_codon:yes stop_codon:yes gene_type:complete